MGGRSSFLYKGSAGFLSSDPARLITFFDYSILEYLRRIIAFLIRGAPGWLVGATLGGKDSEVNTSNVNIVNCITLAKVKISTQLNIISDKKDCMRR